MTAQQSKLRRQIAACGAAAVRCGPDDPETAEALRGAKRSLEWLARNQGWIKAAAGAAFGDDAPAPPGSQRLADKPAAQRAAILGADPMFRAFLFEMRRCPHLADEVAAAAAIRALCGVQSRRELACGVAAARWTALEADFAAWRAAQERGLAR